MYVNDLPCLPPYVPPMGSGDGLMGVMRLITSMGRAISDDNCGVGSSDDGYR